MTEYRSIGSRDIIVGRLGYDCDLLDELTKVSTEHGVTLGRIEAIGAVRKAQIGFYNQETRTYQYNSFDNPMEITNLTGNISLKDGIPFVHAHITMADEAGTSYGGHLGEGTIVFACEFILEAFDGPAFNRSLDEVTGLPLWSIDG
jgi:uncharacterized protein